MSIVNARNAVSDYRDKLKADAVRKEMITDRINELTNMMSVSQHKIEMLEEEQIVVSKAGHDILTQTASIVSEFASLGISSILGSKYRGVVITPNFDNPKSPKASLDLLVEDNKGVVHNISPYEDEGGGLNDLIALGFQLGALTGYTPSVDGPFFMDEVAKHLSGNHTESLSKHIKLICDKSGRQIIFITHNSLLKELLPDNTITL